MFESSQNAFSVLSEEKRRQIVEAFDFFAQNGDFVSVCDLPPILRAFDFEAIDLRATLAKFDPLKSGRIPFAAFAEIVGERFRERSPRAELRRAFRLFVEVGEETIGVKQLRRAARELKEEATDDELREIIEEIDRNGNGFIDEEDFVRVLSKGNCF